MKAVNFIKYLCACMISMWACVGLTACSDEPDMGYYDVNDFVHLRIYEGSDSYFVKAMPSEIEKAHELMSPKDCAAPQLMSSNDNYYIVDVAYKGCLNAEYESDIYLTKDDYMAIVTPHIVVSLYDDKDLDKLLNSYKNILTVSDYNLKDVVPTIRHIHLDCHVKYAKDVIRIANEIHKKKYVEYCTPGILSEIRF